jgi:hypothetical protein
MIKNKLKFYLALLFALSFCYGAGRLYFFFTDGFTVYAIASNITHQKEWKIPELSLEDQKKLNQLIGQSFTYLGKGGQSYVLISSDKKYVMKFFKHKLLQYPFWVKLPLPGFLKELQDSKRLQKEKKRDHIYNSCLIAFNDLRMETGVILVHFNQTDNLPKETIIFDKLGVPHSIDLNQFEFVVQKAALPIQPTIASLAERGAIEEAKKRLDQLILLLVERSKKGIVDLDPAFEPNIGFTDEAAISIDLGQFVKREEIKEPEAYQKDIRQRTALFQKWLNLQCPELGVYFEAKINELN